jgi:uncharacterized protein with HEPN domain
MSFGPREYLRHILAETEFLQNRSADLTREDFLADETLRRAFVRSLEIIGEASKKLPEMFRTQHPEVEWRAMAGMRDHPIHGYFAVDFDLVWDVVATKVPVLHRQITGLLPSPPGRTGA